MKQPARFLPKPLRKQIRSLWFRFLLWVRYRDDGFSPEFYLDRYPDVSAAGADPYEHYVRFGRVEGRFGSESHFGTQGCQGHRRRTLRFGSVFDVMGSFASIDKSRETVLVVCHEGSRTGAPVLGYNLVTQLIEKYNVVALFLGTGPISEACHAAGAVVVGPVAARGSPSLSEAVIRFIVDAAHFKFALINSIESRYVLEALAKRKVPTVSLIHEFAAYTRPIHAFPETAFWSGQMVYSSSITRDNALAEFPGLGMGECPVIPQGRCVLPREEEGGEERRLEEEARIRRVMRPEGFPAGGLVVLGAGYVQLRKGVELFIECAARIRRLRPDLPCRFVWIGKGYYPEDDLAYSVYLADQVRRANLEEVVHFTNEVVDLEAAYALASVFLLSSRLDPLPNVVIDALTRRLPVVCFDKTTGMADILREHGLGEACVAEYLDTEDMTRKILALAESRDLRDQVTERGARLAADTFDMAAYVGRLEQLAAEEAERIEQRKHEGETLSKAKLLRPDYFRPPVPFLNEEEDIQWYLRSWAKSFWRRKPFPGFHPGIYLERHGTEQQGVDPLVDYLRSRRPRGPWNYGMITPGEAATPLPPGLRVGLHIHAYYPELLPALLERLQKNDVRPDLLVSVANLEDRRTIEACLGDHAGMAVDIRVVPNRGRDIGPFLTEFGSAIRKYDIIGHLHTKKTADLRDGAVGRAWYQFLLENLLGGQFSMADIILGRMGNDPSIGMVFPDDPNVVGWGKNLDYVKTLLPRLGIDRVHQEILFPIGTMFWAKTEVLKPLLDMNLQWADYPEEPLPYDGSVLHGLERVLGVLATSGKSTVALTNVPGRSR